MEMLREHSRVVYLHGFASGPTSRKAGFFAGKLKELGFQVDVPDLAANDFQHLTLSGQLSVLDGIAQGGPVTLIGSSMGGYLAALYAARHSEVVRLILLAPAFAFHELWTTQMPPADLARWKETGSVDVFHYGAGRNLPLSYTLLDDAARYESFPDFEQPALIFHGVNDTSVPIRYSEEFERLHPNVRLFRYPSGHELTDVLDRIWTESEEFLLGQPLDFE
jgi:pimeloyl-ACP methyl ester carboxylesterase